jgi:hypothetical protein
MRKNGIAKPLVENHVQQGASPILARKRLDKFERAWYDVPVLKERAMG